MLIAIVPLLIAVIGLMLWALASNGIVKEAGKIMFFCGMLVLTMGMAEKTIRLGSQVGELGSPAVLQA